MDLTTVAVPHTLNDLKPLLPAPPARILEVGCGRGALAAALVDLGYQVTGVDRDAAAVKTARERGVATVHGDVHDISGEYEVVLFTRSLHHAENLDGILDQAVELLTPGGQVIIEEFAWERVDRRAAALLYDNRALLVAAGLLDADHPSGDMLEAWIAGHHSLHQGSAMLAAMARVGVELVTVPTSILWRLVDGLGGIWIEPRTRAGDVWKPCVRPRNVAFKLTNFCLSVCSRRCAAARCPADEWRLLRSAIADRSASGPRRRDQPSWGRPQHGRGPPFPVPRAVLSNMSERFQGLSEQEQAACLIVERVLGVVAEPWDVGGRQGVVDAMLVYPTGRRAAFEVTALSGDGALQTVSLLGRDQFRWPLPGQWTWTIEVGSPADLPQLKGRYARIALQCEAAGLSRPEQLWQRQIGVNPDPDIAWLVEHSRSDMVGHPELPAVDGNRIRSAAVLPASRGGAVDESLTGLRQALEEAFAEPHMVRHLDKTARADTDERHLFLPVHWSALPFPVLYGLLNAGDTLPPESPPLPAAITHLWLAPELARRVLLWTPHGWQNHYPNDN